MYFGTILLAIFLIQACKDDTEKSKTSDIQGSEPKFNCQMIISPIKNGAKAKINISKDHLAIGDKKIYSGKPSFKSEDLQITIAYSFIKNTPRNDIWKFEIATQGKQKNIPEQPFDGSQVKLYEDDNFWVILSPPGVSINPSAIKKTVSKVVAIGKIEKSKPAKVKPVEKDTAKDEKSKPVKVKPVEEFAAKDEKSGHGHKPGQLNKSACYSSSFF